MPILQFLPVIAALLLQLRARLAIALAAAGFALAACAGPPGDESAYATQVPVKAEPRWLAPPAASRP